MTIEVSINDVTYWVPDSQADQPRAWGYSTKEEAVRTEQAEAVMLDAVRRGESPRAVELSNVIELPEGWRSYVVS